MIRAVAWDIDGTLVDSEPLHHKALMAVSDRYGLPIDANDTRFIGVAMEDVWNRLAALYPPTLRRENWLDEIVEAYLGETATLRAIPGAVETVRALAHAGIRQCCVSNSVGRIVEANLEAIGIQDLIEFAVVREDVRIGKPDPEPYALACRRLEIPPNEVLAVEDSASGFSSATAAGLACSLLGRDITRIADLVEQFEKGEVSA